jgi:hypothetical protein
LYAALVGSHLQKVEFQSQKLGPALFRYQPFLSQALLPWQTLDGDNSISALAHMWQIETDLKRRPFSRWQQQRRHRLWKVLI